MSCLIKNTGNSDSNQDGIARTRLTLPPQTTRKLDKFYAITVSIHGAKSSITIPEKREQNK